MKPTNLYRIAKYILFSVLIVFSMTACAASAAQQPAGGATVASAPDAASSNASVETATTQTPTQIPTEVPKPTPLPATATPVPEQLIITAQGFGQSKRGDLGYGFMVENPNQAFCVYGAKYQITYYDADGTAIQTEDGSISSFLPGQKLGVAGGAFLGTDVIVSKIDIQLIQGKAVHVTAFPAGAVFTPLTTEKISYHPASDQYPIADVSGLVVNPYDMTLGYTRVSAIAYNAAGEIIGGGWDTLGFLTPLGTAGVKAQISSSSEVAKVELFPAVNSLYELFNTRKLPEGAQAPTLIKQGYARSDSSTVGWGLLIQNPNTKYVVIQNIEVTYFAEDGSVLGTESDQVTLFPNATTGVGGYSNIREDTDIARADFLINPEIFRESKELPLLTVSKYSLEDQGDWHKITGEVDNPNAIDVDRTTVFAVAYNAAGEIIGGGRGGTELVPANSKANLEMTIFAPDTVTTVEFYIYYDVN